MAQVLICLSETLSLSRWHRFYYKFYSHSLFCQIFAISPVGCYLLNCISKLSSPFTTISLNSFSSILVVPPPSPLVDNEVSRGHATDINASLVPSLPPANLPSTFVTDFHIPSSVEWRLEYRLGIFFFSILINSLCFLTINLTDCASPYIFGTCNWYLFPSSVTPAYNPSLFSPIKRTSTCSLDIPALSHLIALVEHTGKLSM
mmetsp:Transcript_25663/g.54566  ORF Transcript_25663/g.54566 Transcript_25663/m.54566 type:complete len:203 (-) Transcript_25663:716-1324(-)